MHGDYGGVQDGTEHDAPNCPSLGKPHFSPQGKKFPKDAVRHGERSHARRPRPPMIFNIVVDAVVRATLEVVCGPQKAQHGMGWAAGEHKFIFYADDGRIGGGAHMSTR